MEFNPDLKPAQMLRLGVFGGAYFADTGCSEFPKSWVVSARSASVFNPAINMFRVAAGQTRQVWLDKGWINPVDPLGWFQWYCRYSMGRRVADDARQIGRWRNFGPRHTGMLRRNGKGDPCSAAVSRQALLQWGFDPYADIDMQELSVIGKINKLQRKS